MQPTCTDWNLAVNGSQAWPCTSGAVFNMANALAGPPSDDMCCLVSVSYTHMHACHCPQCCCCIPAMACLMMSTVPNTTFASMCLHVHGSHASAYRLACCKDPHVIILSHLQSLTPAQNLQCLRVHCFQAVRAPPVLQPLFQLKNCFTSCNQIMRCNHCLCVLDCSAANVYGHERVYHCKRVMALPNRLHLQPAQRFLHTPKQ